MRVVEPIVAMDDGFHESNNLSAEWWYFDGFFSDDYSFHIGIRTFTRKNNGRAILFFELYKKEEIVFEKKKKLRFKDVKTNPKYPFIQINGKTILEFDIKRYQNQGEWVYHLMLTIDDYAADMFFTSITTGFKIEPKGEESWTVAIPKAKVTGTISYSGKSLSVDGIGYHDHNWNYTLMTVFTYGKGWYWGKINSNTFTIVLANVLKRSGYEDLICVVCPDNDRFYNINPKQMKFKIKDFTKYKHRKIPSCMYLSIDENIDSIPIKVDVTMDVKHVHFSKVLIASYWRYHVNIKGSISVDNKIEHIDNMQIMEYLSMI